jgi:hypothetical protein
MQARVSALESHIPSASNSSEGGSTPTPSAPEEQDLASFISGLNKHLESPNAKESLPTLPLVQPGMSEELMEELDRRRNSDLNVSLPQPPVSLNSPQVKRFYIDSMKPQPNPLKLENIVTADLESLIMKDGTQMVYMGGR